MGRGVAAKLLFRSGTRWKFKSHFLKMTSEKSHICFPQLKSALNSILINNVSKEKSFVYLFSKQRVQVFFHLKLLY